MSWTRQSAFVKVAYLKRVHSQQFQNKKDLNVILVLCHNDITLLNKLHLQYQNRLTQQQRQHKQS